MSAPTTPAAPGRAWVNVPYAQKEDVKAHGGRWDGTVRCWHVPTTAAEALARWPISPAVPTTSLPGSLPGEDRGYQNGLFVDLIPQTSWFTNVRSAVAGSDWDRLRNHVYDRAGQCCEACGQARRAPYPAVPGLDTTNAALHAHERFTYDPATGTQTLTRLVALCGRCHEVTHMGLAQVRGRDAQATAWLRHVNGWTARHADQHISAAFDTWQQRSRRPWTVDLAIISAAGYTVTDPASARPSGPTRPAEPPRDQDRIDSPGWMSRTFTHLTS